jgi:hypothetical protein
MSADACVVQEEEGDFKITTPENYEKIYWKSKLGGGGCFYM